MGRFGRLEGSNGKSKTIFLMYMGSDYIIKVALFFRFGLKGVSLFSKWKAESAILCTVSYKKLKCFVYLFVKGSGARPQNPARADSRLSAQSSNKRVSIT